MGSGKDTKSHDKKDSRATSCGHGVEGPRAKRPKHLLQSDSLGHRQGRDKAAVPSVHLAHDPERGHNASSVFRRRGVGFPDLFLTASLNDPRQEGGRAVF